MSHLTVDLGGRPGLDCRGFCSYCYFKHVRGTTAFGCRHCLPFKKGCDYCTRGVREGYEGFKDLRTVAEEMGVGHTFSLTPVGVYFGDGPGVTSADPFFGGVGPERTGCIECGECEPKCPQKIKIIEQLREVAGTFKE